MVELTGDLTSVILQFVLKKTQCTQPFYKQYCAIVTIRNEFVVIMMMYTTFFIKIDTLRSSIFTFGLLQ